MTSSLIRFNDKHIFAAQAIMGFTHNLSKSLDTEIHGYLQDARFLHVSCECTITLNDISLQIGFSEDELVVTGSTVILGKENLCETFLGKKLRRATKLDKMSIDGYLLLLQSWAWNYGLSYVGPTKQLEDIRLLLDQRLKAEFEWMLYADPNIIECVPLEFLAIRSIWEVKMPLIVYVAVEMHEIRPTDATV
ncbi:hypothetical protein Goari_022144 [Gossypium aridum]|uniref:Aminotransferase-like plant mobile domain-containing protein n=1 Tax=Gossypium aridum TaxID=34290 RepID=A0A7J8YUD0_GOSAI|nr:hypothetical protein [Gossypium aridum]